MLAGVWILLGPLGTARDTVGGGFIEIDAVVTDRYGHPVHGLGASDFVLKEDHQVARILTSQEISSNASGSHEPCVLAVVLDDVAVVPSASDLMQRLAWAFLARATDADRIAVVRFSHDRGELLFGRLSDALLAIRNYTARGDVQFDEPTLSGWLDLLADVATQLGESEGRRNTIVAIGSPSLLDPSESWYRAIGRSASRWAHVVARLAQANAAFYIVDPSGLNSYRAAADAGIASVSGGRRFGTLDFNRVRDAIWQDMANYYVLSYIPLTSRSTHDVDVAARQRGVSVLARHRRGE